MGLSMRLASSLTMRIIYGLALCVPRLVAQELKLADAIQLAVEHNRQLAAKELEVAKTGEEISSLHTRLFPAVRFEADLFQQLVPIEYTIQQGQLGNYGGIGP